MWRLLILLLLVYKSALGHEIIISPEASTVKITTQAGVAIDARSNLTIDQLSQTKFKYDYKSINFGRKDDTVWIKLNIKNTLNNPNIIVNINNPTLDKISLFQQFQGRWKKTELGDLREFHHRLINLPSFAIPILISKNNPEIIYLRIQSIDTLRIPIKIFSQNDFSYYLYSHYLSFGILYGIPLGLLLYNLLIFISVRKRTHLLYCLVIISNTLVSLSWDGIIYSFFPDSPYFQQRSIPLSMCLTIIFLILFAKSFLQTKFNTPKINTYLNITAFSATILLLLALSPNTSLFYIPIVILAMVIIPGLIAAGIVRMRQQYVPAKIHLLATGSFLFAVALCALSVLNILPFQEEITYIYKVGVASELILLSLGIAERIKALKISKQAAIEKIRAIEKEKLKSENLALSNANYLKDTFLSTISHELRTPMNGVKGALALLDTEQNEAHRNQLISTINQSSDSMIKLIDRLILFTELKAGRIRNIPSYFSIKELVDNEMKHWRDLCDKKSILLETHINIEKSFQGDKANTKWILTEIVDNAIKFSSSGKIFISIELTDSNSMIISVCDQGKGIPEELTSELKGSFRQEDERFNRKYEGLGLGLSITSELVKLLSGQLSIEVHKEFSTCINIEIPLIKAEPEAISIFKTKPRYATYPLRVLIIEDNIINQMVLEKTLNNLGHNTTIAGDGLEGYKIAKSQLFDLILMDCQMPNIDGYECTNKIRSSDNLNCHTLIIAITANASETNKEHCLKVGMDDYRKKPIKTDTIKELLDKYFIWTNQP
ncbi:MAG: response regulator [Oleispira sp.]|nr:response regulator [Oleispira sp.]